MKRQLKKSVVYGLYALSFILLVGGITLLGFSFKDITEQKLSYVSKGILDYEEVVRKHLILLMKFLLLIQKIKYLDHMLIVRLR